VAEEQSRHAARIKRVGKFGIVGVLNTLLDFLIYNVLSSEFGLGLIQANIISTTVAMISSFFANKKLVFRAHHGSVAKQAIMFYAVTAFGLYIIQNGVIHLLTDAWLWPTQMGLMAFHLLGINGHDAFLVKNGAKAVATLASMIWNYTMYRKLVFR
jgi:putative flippase GtrA